MRKTTQRAIKAAIAEGIAQDITSYNFHQAQALHHAHSLETVALSTGIYGMNGAILKDETGALYAIKARTSCLFQLV